MTDQTRTVDESQLRTKIETHLLDPSHAAGLYFLYRELAQYRERMFFISSGNALGLLKYHGHLPWDDDIDLGFITDNSFSEYLVFLKWAIEHGFIVNCHLKETLPPVLENQTSVREWWREKRLCGLTLTSEEANGHSNLVSFEDLTTMCRSSPDDFFFANVTFKPEVWSKLLERVGGTKYYWCPETETHLVTPWIDFIPYRRETDSLTGKDRLVSIFQPYPRVQPSLSATLKSVTFFDETIYVPIDLRTVTCKFYFGELDFDRFYKTEEFYCHLLKRERLALTYTENEIDSINEIVHHFNEQVKERLIALSSM